MNYIRYNFTLDDSKIITFNYELSSTLIFCNGFFLDSDSYVAEDGETISFPKLKAGHQVDIFVIDDLDLKTSLVSILSVLEDYSNSINLLSTTLSNFETNQNSISLKLDNFKDLIDNLVYSNSNNGYIELFNGLLLQWGSYTSNDDDFQTVNYPISFSKPLSIATNMATGYEVQLYNSYFKFDRYDSVNGSQKHYYIAIGLK